MTDIITIPKTWGATDTLTHTDLNENFSYIATRLNGANVEYSHIKDNRIVVPLSLSVKAHTGTGSYVSMAMIQLPSSVRPFALYGSIVGWSVGALVDDGCDCHCKAIIYPPTGSYVTGVLCLNNSAGGTPAVLYTSSGTTLASLLPGSVVEIQLSATSGKDVDNLNVVFFIKTTLTQ